MYTLTGHVELLVADEMVILADISVHSTIMFKHLILESLQYLEKVWCYKHPSGHWTKLLTFSSFFLAFAFCRFCVVILLFHPRHNGQRPPTSKDFYTRSYPLHYFLILILEKEPVFPFSMLSAKQGNYWYPFYNVFGMTRSLTGHWTRDLLHSMPALYH